MKYYYKNITKTPNTLLLLSALWNEVSDNKHKKTNVANCPFYATLL